MRLSRFSILFILVILMTVGAAVLPYIDVAEQPLHRQGHTLTITYRWDGASAKVMEQNVTSRIEGLVSAVRGVQSVESESWFGSARIKIELKPQANVSATKFEVLSLLRQVYKQLPEGVSYLDLTGGEVAEAEGRNDEQLLLTYRVNADMNDNMLSEYVRQAIEPKLKKIDGVRRIDITGVRGKVIDITYDSRAMEAYGITAGDIEDAVRSFIGKDDSYLATEPFAKPIEQMPVKQVDGKIVYLNDLATFEYKDKLPDSYFRINGLNTIYLNIYIASDADKISMSRQVRGEIEAMSASLKKGVFLSVEHDSAEESENELHKLLWRTLMTLVILLAFVWIVSRSVKYLAITAITLAANMLIAAIFYKLLDIRLHIYSLAGITVSIGLVIDATIVMVDHYSYNHNKRAFIAILAALLTTVGALVAVFWLPDFLNDNLYDFALIVVVNLSVALLVAFLFVPAIVDWMGYSSRRNSNNAAGIRWAIIWSDAYSAYIRHVVRFKWIYTVLFLLLTGIPLYYYADEVIEGSNVTERGTGDKVLHVRAQMPVGGSVHELNDKVAMLESFLSTFSEIKRFETKVGQWGATIDVEFKDEYKAGAFPYVLENKVIGKVITIGGADWATYGVSERGFSNSLNLQYRANRIEVSGYNYERLYRIAEDMYNEMKKNNRVVDLAIVTPGYENQEDEYYVVYDKKKIAAYGMDIREAHDALKEKTTVRDIPRYRDQYITADMRLIPSERNSFDMWSLENATLKVGDRQLCLSDILDVERREANNCVPRRNQEYVLHLAFNVLGSYTYTDRYIKSVVTDFNAKMPVGFMCKNATSGYQEEDDGTQYWYLLLIIVIIYFICAILFESLTLPLAIIMLVPLSFVGAFAAWYVMGIRLGEGAYAALVMLCGLTVNGGIYIASEYQNILKQGTKRMALKAYSKAYNHKIKAVFLTIVSTVLGLVPFFFDNEDIFWYPLAIGATCGLLLSMVALVFIMPVYVVPCCRVKSYISLQNSFNCDVK